MLHFLKLFFVVFLLIAGFASFCFADGWAPVIEKTLLVPEYVLAVDKGSQKFHVLVHKSPLQAKSSFACATGQVVGDKKVEGDRKTPEGVYFTTGKRAGVDDFVLYGTMAFPLNFPNAVDTINGKTGHGIWIHGRGKKLVPLDTKGCVALNNSDIEVVDSIVKPGSPVIIGESVEWDNASGSQVEEAKELEGLVYNWAESWQNMDAGFFEMYAPALYTKSGSGNFKSFAKRKKRIFSRTKWIDIEIFNMHALQGPGYWVTWFDQYYRSGQLTSSSSKRLYWQKIDGRWKIVGREYGPVNPNLKKKYLQAKTASVEKFLGEWRASWLAADIDGYASYYDSEARQSVRRGIDAIKKQKKYIWAKRKPDSIEFGDFKLREHPDGLEVVFSQKYSDVSGYSDKGLKKIVIRPDHGSWVIVDEQWRKL